MKKIFTFCASVKNWINVGVQLFVLVLLMNGSLWGQVSNYTFSQSSGTYSAITGGSVYNSTPTRIDDQVYNDLPIGFTFNYNGVDYTRFSISANGFIAMGTSVSSSSIPISSGSSNNIISGAGMDLRAINTSTSSNIRYETLGSSPNRTLVVQWTAFAHYSDNTNLNLNFQIRLSETTNVVSIIYGTFTSSSTTERNPHIGLRGNSNSDYNNRTLTSTTTWLNNTSAGTANSNTVRFRSSAIPASGTTFTWSPPAPCSGTPNIPTASIASSSGCSGSTVALTSSGFSSGTGISYQWQLSPDNTNWSNIGGATSTSYSLTTVEGTNYYRLQTTCSASGHSSVSNSVSYVGTLCINMPSSGSSTTCNALFFDSGGSSGEYSNGENRTYTFYPATPNSKIKIEFTSFTTESSSSCLDWDIMRIYDGNSTSAPLVATSQTGCASRPSPGTIVSTAADGSLTIHWKSDGGVTAAGWSAIVSCESCTYGIDGTLSASSPTTVCVGEPITVTAAGGTGVPRYWVQSPVGSGTWNVVENQASNSASNGYTLTPGSAGTYRIHARWNDNCGFCWDNPGHDWGSNNFCTSSASVDFEVVAPAGDQTSYGTNSWIGYAYKSNTAGAFSTYLGYVTESETFNRSHTSPTGQTTNLACNAPTDLFAIRYKMNKTFDAGWYTFTVGGDDGVRLSINGGSTWLINQWIDQGYTTTTSSAVYLSGSTSLVFEYYENSGGAQSSFSYQSVLPPAPTTVTCNPTSFSTMDASWSSVNGATYYYYQIQTNSTFAGWGNGVFNSSTSGTSASFTGLSSETMYYVFVASVTSAWEWNGTNVSSGCTTPCQPPTNETCSGATTLTIDAPASTGTLNCATFESPFSSRGDVWYKFTPSCTGNHTITLSNFLNDKDLHIYSSCGNSTALDSSAGTSSTETITRSFNSNTTYYIRVLDWTGTGGSFSIRVTSSIAAPSQPSVISGTLDPEPGNSETYSVTNVAGVAYAWTFPSGWVINSGQGSNSVTVTVGSTNGTISVTPSSCGINGTARTATTTIPNFRARFVSADYGSSDWCTGETRTVNVTIKNTGINTWTNSSPDINIGVKWNTNGASWHDFHSRTDANNLAPGDTRTYNLTISAKDATAGPTYGNNLASGINNLSFSVVYEGCFWFNAASGTYCSVTLGNTPTYTSGAINIKPVPNSVDAGIGGEICNGQSFELGGSAVSPSNSILHKATELNDFQEFGTNDTDRWGIFSSAQAGGSSPELGFQWFAGTNPTPVFAWAAGPIINATNYTTLNVSFKHTVEWFTGTVPLYFQTTTDGVTWTTKWNLNATSFVAPETVSINLDDLAGTIFSYRFLFDGNIWNIDYWFIDDIILSGTPTLTYSWTPSATLTNSNTLTPVASPGSTTTYTFTATANGCSASDEVTVTVNQLPTTVVNERCLNGSRGVEITGSGGSGVYTEYQQLGNSVQATNFYTINLGESASFLIKDNKGCWSEPEFYQAPPAPTVISNSGSSGQCILRGLDTWSHVLDADNKVIVSILDGGNDIGWINANVTVEPTTQNFQSTAYLRRNYDISVQAQPSSNVTLRLYFTEEEYNELVTESFNNNNNQDNVYSIEHLKVTKYQGPNVNNNYADNDFDCVPCFAVLTPIAHGEEFGSKYIDIQIGGFSEFWVHGGSSNDSWLPVELLSFDAKCDNDNALIEWATATEINNDYFSVQRSRDGVSFETIGRVNGAGNNNGYLSYKFLDSQKSNDRVYYRLTQTDYDGTVTIYSPKSLNCSSNSTIIKAVPNPFSDNLLITSNISDLCLIEIMSSNGKKVYSEKKSINGNMSVDLSHLAPGMYFLTITEVSGKQHHIKLVKK